MALREQTKTRTLPDDNGGWYWLRKGKNSGWKPVRVEEGGYCREWTGGNGHVNGTPSNWEWGPEIEPPPAT